jgi:hypothetical protein
VQATDSDRSKLHRQLRYWIPSPPRNPLGGQLLTIEPTTGVIRVQQPIDREALARESTGNLVDRGDGNEDIVDGDDSAEEDVVLAFEVRVSDMNAQFGETTIHNATATVRVRVLDDNDVTPHFTQGTVEISVSFSVPFLIHGVSYYKFVV